MASAITSAVTDKNETDAAPRLEPRIPISCVTGEADADAQAPLQEVQKRGRGTILPLT